tara:strand:+ start:211 stop:525 length:315 start_codon:yes stop_codon:yes gene_type:complete
MDFYDISEEEQPRPGEMLLYSPRHSIVVCAGIVDNKLRAFDRGTFLEDDMEQFKKIKITKKEYKKRSRSKCKGCGGGNKPEPGISTSVLPSADSSGCKGCGTKG